MTKEILEALDAGGKDSSFEIRDSRGRGCEIRDSRFEIRGDGDARFEIGESRFENCGFAPPGAEEAKPEFPQPPDWRAEATKPGPGIGMRQGVAETGDERFEIGESRFENCGFAPPGAEDGQATDSLDPDSQNSNLKTQNSSAAALRQRAAAHLDSLRRQAEALREEFPDFDLDAALRDPDFLRLTAPGLGVDLRRAYYALHREDLDSRAARRAAEETRRRLARSLASGGLRPREGGGQEAAAALASDYRSLSRPQQLALKQRIIEAAARGEKIYP